MTDTWITLGLYAFGVLGGFIAGYLRGIDVTEKDYQQRIQGFIKHRDVYNATRTIELHFLRKQLAKFHTTRDKTGRFTKRQ